MRACFGSGDRGAGAVDPAVRVFSDKEPAGGGWPADPYPTTEKRLQRLREQAAMAPGRETVLKQVTAELADP